MKLKPITGITLILGLITATTLLSTGIPSLFRSGNFQASQSGTTVGGSIYADTNWTLAGSPYIVVSGVNVLSTATLTIEAGVVVKFADGTNLLISGGLIARGNLTHNITFTSNSTVPAPNAWDSVYSSGTTFIMDYVIIEYADKGLSMYALVPTNISNSVISNCNVGVEGKLGYATNLTVTDNSADGLSLSGSPLIEIRIEKSVISSNGGNGITVTDNSKINMDDCTVSNNTGNGVVLSNGRYIKNSRINGNGCNGTCILGSATIENTTVSGNVGDGIWAESGMSIAECHITGNGGNGIKSNHVEGTPTIENTAISGNVGDGIWTGSNMTIKECNITDNAGNGISGHLLTHGFSLSIENCTVSNNNQTGVTVPTDGTPEYVNMYVDASMITSNNMSGLSGRGYVHNSTVSGNMMCGILGNFTVREYNTIAWNQGGGFNGTGSIYWSSIYDNTPYDAVADRWPNNITATSNWWGTNDGALIRQHIWDHENDSMLGSVDYSDWLPVPPQPIDRDAPEIASIVWKRTRPLNQDDPYDATALWPQPRINEPVRVYVNVTDDTSPVPSGVDKVLLSYRVNVGEWWNTTLTLVMMYNATSGNWTALIPPQPANSTVEFFIQAYDKAGNSNMSSGKPYQVKNLPIGDVNGDGKVDIKDILQVAKRYGQTDP